MKCAQCGHDSYKHHGADYGERPDAGCMALGSGRLIDGEWTDTWCHCPLTCAEATANSELTVRP